jgi:hypothetical protein
MKILATIFFLIMIASCITQKEVNTWLNDHKREAAGYCADNFPPDTTARVVTDSVDTAAYEAAYQGMEHYADSLFMELKRRRESYIPTPQAPCPPSVNLDSLRKAVDAEMRKRLAPCKDSLQKIVYTVVDKARERQLQGKLDENEAIRIQQQKDLLKTIDRLDKTKKWPWLFWLLVALIGGYTFIKIRYKLPF